eukprot:6197082-Pleurochrysis_carterae.AAC.1
MEARTHWLGAVLLRTPQLLPRQLLPLQARLGVFPQQKIARTTSIFSGLECRGISSSCHQPAARTSALVHTTCRLPVSPTAGRCLHNRLGLLETSPPVISAAGVRGLCSPAQTIVESSLAHLPEAKPDRFAVMLLAGTQYKVTVDDMIVTERINGVEVRTLWGQARPDSLLFDGWRHCHTLHMLRADKAICVSCCKFGS